MSFMLGVIYAWCHKEAIYAECHYVECHYAECRYAECLMLNVIAPFKNTR
jgi:hypothetical protein